MGHGGDHATASPLRPAGIGGPGPDPLRRLTLVLFYDDDMGTAAGDHEIAYDPATGVFRVLGHSSPQLGRDGTSGGYLGSSGR